MKTLSAFLALILMTANISAQEAAAKNGKILIAYFSWGGNTRAVAAQIQKTADGDLFEIRTVQKYPTNYRECVDAAKKELRENVRPALATKVNGMDSYDIIFVGYPNWWGTIPMPVFTFLESHDFKGKTIAPFCTHGGGGLGRGVGDIKKNCPDATLLQGLAVSGTLARKAQNDVDAWLGKLGLGK